MARSLTSRILNDRLFWLALVIAPAVWLFFRFTDVYTPNLKNEVSVIVMLVLVYPILEEILFRGLIQPGLLYFQSMRRSLAGVTHANLVASVLFVILHLFANSLIWSLLVFVPSLVFGFFRDRHATLLTPLLLHIYYNLGFVLLNLR